MNKNIKVRWLIIEENHVGQRIDNYLLGKLKGVPRSYTYRILRKGEVRVNKKRVKPLYKLQLGDQVRIPPLEEIDNSPSQAKSKPSSKIVNLLTDRILWEDENLLIINKPSGIPVHGGSGISWGLIETIRYWKKENNFLELVHRVDKETSGCLMIAKNPKTLKELHELLREGKIEKHYQLLVHGLWPSCLKKVNLPLKKQVLLSGERIVKVNNEGKQALTYFEVISTFKNHTWLIAKPATGRTHQIRVHCQSKGHPLVGDKKYGISELDNEVNAKRLCLHASELHFKLSFYNKKINLFAPLDKDISQLLNNIP